jgi:hypothetical protein
MIAMRENFESLLSVEGPWRTGDLLIYNVSLNPHDEAEEWRILVLDDAKLFMEHQSGSGGIIHSSSEGPASYTRDLLDREIYGRKSKLLLFIRGEG